MLVANKVIGFILKLRETVVVAPYSRIIEYKPYPAYPVWQTWFDFTQMDTDILNAQSTADEALALANGIGGNVYPDGWTISPYSMSAVSGGFAAPVYSTATWLNMFCLMSGNNTISEIQLPLASGDYQIDMLMTKGSSSGDPQLLLDGTSLGTFSGYAASNTNAVITWTANSVVEGTHNWRIKVNGHQPSSSGYNLAVSQFTIRRQ